MLPLASLLCEVVHFRLLGSTPLRSLRCVGLDDVASGANQYGEDDRDGVDRHAAGLGLLLQRPSFRPVEVVRTCVEPCCIIVRPPRHLCSISRLGGGESAEMRPVADQQPDFRPVPEADLANIAETVFLY